jgi:hypothetical protein
VAQLDVAARNDDRMVALSTFGILRGRKFHVPFPISLSLASLPVHQPRRIVNACAIAAATVIAALAMVADGGRASGSSTTTRLPLATPPEPPPLLLRDITEQDAIAVNGRIPFSIEANVPARPFRIRDDDARSRALECLAMAVYYEAGSEDLAGQEAVAQVVLNRVRHPAFPGSICGVVFQGYARSTGCQFTFTCDGSLLRTPDPRIWARARQVAEAALNGGVFKPVGLATHYHANYVVPYWATSLEKNAQVGVHIFYRWPDAWGMPAAFSRRYAEKEADPTTLRTAAIMDNGDWARGVIRPDDGIQLIADPRIELLAVVQMLANGNSNLTEIDRRYEKDVKSYFVPEADHPAVQLFTKLSKDNAGFAASAGQLLLGYSALPELAGPAPGDKDLAQFIDALRDFARSSEFSRFFAGHKPFYSAVIGRAQRNAALTRGYWEAYTGMPLRDRKLILSSLVTGNGSSKCGDTRLAPASTSLLSLGTLAQASEAETFLSTEGGPEGLNKPRPNKPEGADSATAWPKILTANPVLREQVVRAVFARVAGLSRGDSAGRLAVQREVRNGYTMVPFFEARLRYYEAHRDQFATLANFIPQLIAGANKSDPTKNVVAATEPKAAVTQCGIEIAAAQTSAAAPSGGQ